MALKTTPMTHETVPPGALAPSRQNPYWAEIISHERLSRPGSSKDTRHLVFDLGSSGIKYEPGDSLGAFGCNSPELVKEVLACLGFDPEYPLKREGNDNGFTVLREALTRDYILNRANRKIVTAMVERVPQGESRNRLTELANNSDLLCEYLDTRDFVDVLREFPEVRFDRPESFLAQLTPVTPRLYSIASSLAVHPGEVHLCVAVVRYDTHGRPKKGLASGFLADHADVFVKSVPVYVQPSRTFRLPADRSRDIIMIGPGTGIAPFRAFVEQRKHDAAQGRNWLFFGEQHQATDFLYESEWKQFLASGHLHRLDLAFSRDQPQKIYVQHRMREQAKEMWSWLQNGAYVYVCGDAKHMAKDVHETLIEIARTQGGMSAEGASEYVNVTLMKTEKRYLRDVY